MGQEYTARLSELLYPLAVLNADSNGAGNDDSGYVSLRDYHRAWLVVDVGDMQAGATLDIQIRQAINTSGGSVKAITGKASTQLTQAGGDGNDLVCIELQTEELDVDGGFDCISARLTVANAAVEYSAVLYGASPSYMPTPTTNWQEVIG